MGLIARLFGVPIVGVGFWSLGFHLDIFKTRLWRRVAGKDQATNIWVLLGVTPTTYQVLLAEVRQTAHYMD